MLKRKNEEFVSDPHELILSLVDMGSLDIEDVLLTCVSEMSDAECKRVLNSLSLPKCCEEEPEEPEDLEDDLPADDDLSAVADEIVDEEPEDDLEDHDEEDAEDEDDFESRSHELESRISRLERVIRHNERRSLKRSFRK